MNARNEPAAVRFTLHLQKEFSLIQDRDSFKQTVLRDVATAAGVSEQQLEVVNVEACLRGEVVYCSQWGGRTCADNAWLPLGPRQARTPLWR